MFGIWNCSILGRRKRSVRDIALDSEKCTDVEITVYTNIKNTDEDASKNAKLLSEQVKCWNL